VNEKFIRLIYDRARKQKRKSEDLPAVIDARSLSRCSSQEARQKVSFERASELSVLPLGLMKLYNRTVLIAASPSQDIELEQKLKFLAGTDVKLVPTDAAIICEAIFLAYQGDDSNITNAATSLRSSALPPDTLSPSKILFRSYKEGPAGFVTTLIDYAIAQEASDIHLIPRIDGSFVKLRRRGLLSAHPEPLCPPQLHKQLINRLKVLAGLDIAQSNIPQDGSFDVPVAGKSAHVRLSIMPTIHGEKAVLRIFGARSLVGLDELGYERRTMQMLQSFFEKQDGALFIAGPTGCGKSTSLYALANYFASQNLNCVSVEDPVELYLDRITQTSINSDLGLDYASGLKAVLRQDPDVIMIGEIRDSDSAQVALQAAITGHIILSSVHARNPFEVLLRLKNFNLDALTISQGLSLIICQMLLPELCEECKVIDLEPTNHFSKSIYKEVGCAACDYTGFSAVFPVTRALEIDATLKRLISRSRWNASERYILKHTESEDNYTRQLKKALFLGKISAKQFASMTANG